MHTLDAQVSDHFIWKAQCTKMFMFQYCGTITIFSSFTFYIWLLLYVLYVLQLNVHLNKALLNIWNTFVNTESTVYITVKYLKSTWNSFRCIFFFTIMQHLYLYIFLIFIMVSNWYRWISLLSVSTTKMLLSSHLYSGP